MAADLTSTNMNEGYATQSKSKYNVLKHEAGENNLLPSQTIPSDDNEWALADITATTSLL